MTFATTKAARRAAGGRCAGPVVVLGDAIVRTNRLCSTCVVLGLAITGPLSAQSALDPPPLPQPNMPRVFMPTISPYPGTMPQQPAPTNNQPPRPAPVYNQPPQSHWSPTPNQPLPRPAAQMPAPTPVPQQNPVVPASASNPAQRFATPNATPATPLPTPGPLPQAALQPALVITQSSPMAAPALATAGGVLIEKKAPDVVTLNQPLVYEICVRNAGPMPVCQVRVEDELPPGAHYLGGEPFPEVGADRLTWTLNTLEPGGERRLRVELKLAAEGELRSTATVHYSAVAQMKTQVVQPRITLAMRGPEQVTLGDPAPFQILVSNPGSGPATNLWLRGKLPEGLTHAQGPVIEAEIGTLGPGESRSVTLTTQAAKSGKFINEMVATADGGLEASAHATISITGPALQLQRIGPAKCYWKSEVNLELELANVGTAAASYVEMADTLPPGLEFVSASAGGYYDPTTRTIGWRLPVLPPGGRHRVAYRVKATTVGEMPDRAAARCERGGDVRSDATFVVEGIPALSLEVVDLEDPVEVGGELTYEIRVVNQGSCPCTNIQITAQIPDGLQAREGTGPSPYRANGSQVVFEPLAKLGTKADAVYRVKVRGMQPGDYRFRVQMTCEQLHQPVNKEEASRVYKDGM